MYGARMAPPMISVIRRAADDGWPRGIMCGQDSGSDGAVSAAQLQDGRAHRWMPRHSRSSVPKSFASTGAARTTGRWRLWVTNFRSEVAASRSGALASPPAWATLGWPWRCLTRRSRGATGTLSTFRATTRTCDRSRDYRRSSASWSAPASGKPLWRPKRSSIRSSGKPTPAANRATSLHLVFHGSNQDARRGVATRAVPRAAPRSTRVRAALSGRAR